METVVERRVHLLAWVLPGAGLFVCMGVLAVVSPGFAYGTAWSSRPVIAVTLLLMAASIPYFVACLSAWKRAPGGWAWWGWMLGVGLGMRLVMLPSTPVMEDDFYRYLWDGGVVAHGLNPYSVVPEAVLAGDPNLSKAVLALGAPAGLALARTNHPQLGTIYPPVAQLGFALAHVIAPWQTLGLRVLWLALDLLTLCLLGYCLPVLRRPPALLIVYWWNPLLVKEVHNGLHMDVLLLPLLVLVLLLSGRGHHRGALVALACAVGVKVWPVLLAPLVWWPLRGNPGRAAGGALLFAVLLAMLLLPMFPVLELGRDSGLVSYGERWEMNDALFMLFPGAVRCVGSVFDWEPGMRVEQLVARLLVSVLLALLALVLTWRYGETPRARARSMLALTAALFLLSPTQFPWYFVWLLPFLTVNPRPALLLLTTMLPVYYLRFHYQYVLGDAGRFHYGVVWWEYGPVWIALFAEGIWALWRRGSVDAGAPLEPAGE